jgi:hypothetical protein
MKKGGNDVKGCFLLGKATSTPPSLRVSLRIGHDGRITSLDAKAPGSETTQLECAEKVIKRLSFSRFCGDDVEVGWTYSLGG